MEEVGPGWPQDASSGPCTLGQLTSTLSASVPLTEKWDNNPHFQSNLKIKNRYQVQDDRVLNAAHTI